MLEVSPEMAHMMDTIIMTFIYVAQFRKDKEQVARHRHPPASGGEPQQNINFSLITLNATRMGAC